MNLHTVRILVPAAWGALVLAVLPGCASDDDEPEAASAPEPVLTPVEKVEGELAGIREALPADLRESIRFEIAELEDGDLVGAVPEGWESGAIPWSLRPPDDAELGFQTKYGLGLSCAGRCEPKDWKATLEENVFAQFLASDVFEIVRDEPVPPNGRLLVAERGDTVYIAVAWWKSGASRYGFCRATLDGAAAPAAEAFERACLAAELSL